jgi:multisubunit Na+/H+ antiporter MnhE subunit
MSRFLTTFLLSFLLYLALTTGTGHVGIWNTGELVTGLILSLLVGALVGPVLPGGWAKNIAPASLVSPTGLPRWSVLLGDGEG